MAIDDTDDRSNGLNAFVSTPTLETGLPAAKTRLEVLTEDVHHIAQQGKDQARKIGEEAKSRAFREVEDRKGGIADRIDDLADRLEVAAGGDVKAVDNVAQSIRRVSATLRDHSTRELLETAQRRMSANPGAVLAGCLAIGFLGARMLRR